MRICRKCQAQTEEAGQICRACGGILEEVESDVAVEEPAHESADESTDESEPQPLVLRHDWLCPQCGETVPGSFDLCWKCMKNRPNDAPLASLGAMPSALTPDDAPAAAEDEDDGEPDIDAPVRILSSHGIEEPAESREAAVADSHPAEAPSECVRCGSGRIIRGAYLLTPQNVLNPSLQTSVVVVGNQDSFFFPNRVHGEVVTDVCGECGHIHLRVANPAAFYDQVQQSRREQNR